MDRVAERSIAELRRLLAEPLTVFALVAAGFFVYHGLMALPATAPRAPASATPQQPNPSREIIVTPQLIAALEQDFAWLEGRPPNAAETRALIRNWLDDEILFREALARDMHLTDGKTRERLVDKVRMLWIGNPEAPPEPKLLDYYLQNVELYYTDSKISFEHVYFEQEPGKTDSVLASLRAGVPVAGDEFWLGKRLERYDESILRATFGGGFFERLATAAEGSWIGPLVSPRGRHFVRVDEVVPPSPLPYADIREQVLEDWMTDFRNRRIAAKIDELEAGYDIHEVARND
jgi:hypothetical protein